MSTSQPDLLSQVFRPHDLLWASAAEALSAAAVFPPWADTSWRCISPLVVRRESVSRQDLIPVGLRGVSRSARFAAYLRRNAVIRCATPESLRLDAADYIHLQARYFLAFATLENIAAALDDAGLCWGPTGSVGYEAATHIPVVNADSDLDMLVRAPHPLNTTQCTVLTKIITGSACRLDIQIETPLGGFSFAEWQQKRGKVLLKTATGPFLVSNPWQVHEVHESSQIEAL